MNKTRDEEEEKMKHYESEKKLNERDKKTK
jgi:hypothetical protein